MIKRERKKTVELSSEGRGITFRIGDCDDRCFGQANLRLGSDLAFRQRRPRHSCRDGRCQSLMENGLTLESSGRSKKK